MPALSIQSLQLTLLPPSMRDGVGSKRGYATLVVFWLRAPLSVRPYRNPSPAKRTAPNACFYSGATSAIFSQHGRFPQAVKSLSTTVTLPIFVPAPAGGLGYGRLLAGAILRAKRLTYRKLATGLPSRPSPNPPNRKDLWSRSSPCHESTIFPSDSLRVMRAGLSVAVGSLGELILFEFVRFAGLEGRIVGGIAGVWSNLPSSGFGYYRIKWFQPRLMLAYLAGRVTHHSHRRHHLCPAEMTCQTRPQPTQTAVPSGSGSMGSLQAGQIGSEMVGSSGVLKEASHSSVSTVAGCSEGWSVEGG